MDSSLGRHGISSAIAPYPWGQKTVGEEMLSDRMLIQRELTDPQDINVPSTICLFGELCGVPLRASLPDEWGRRIASTLSSECLAGRALDGC